MKKRFLTLTFLLFSSLIHPGESQSARLKDISQIKGVRDNMLMGYGLVVGLNGTGDKAGADFTLQSIVNLLESQGISVSKDDLTVKNVAAVMITAKLPPFAGKGSLIDVLVSTMGDAKSLQGGTLLMTPVLGPDGKVYAVAQGPISVGGFAAEGESGQVQKNHPTVGKIVNGAIVEREIAFDISIKKGFTLMLDNADFLTASRVEKVINSTFGSSVATAKDARSITVTLPDNYEKSIVQMIAGVESLDVSPDVAAKIIIDERTGTVVLGENIKISTVAVAHGNLSIQISETPLVSQPGPFSAGQTVVTTESEVEVKEEDRRLILLEEGVRLRDVVNALNAIGVKPRDLISVLQAIKASGALHAELEVI